MIQKLINKLYRKPKGKIKDIFHLGGPFVYLQMKSGMKEMEVASKSLKVVMPEPLTNQSPSVCFLTGSRFWFQTIFCLYSLQKVTPFAIRFQIFDDGSITDELEGIMKQQVPGIVVHRKSEIDDLLREILPESKYPYLNHKRKVYPHIKKLIDVHAGNHGWRIVADSDMLFLKTPTVLLDWLGKPDKPFYILDKFNSYGFSNERINSVLNGQIPDRVNVGLIGLKSEKIDWDLMEKWASELERNTFSSYYLEQTLSAMLLYCEDCVIGPDSEYIVMPTHEEVINKIGTLHHYVDTSKPDYFIHAWKKII